jgi:hypothetical protein
VRHKEREPRQLSADVYAPLQPAILVANTNASPKPSGICIYISQGWCLLSMNLLGNQSLGLQVATESDFQCARKPDVLFRHPCLQYSHAPYYAILRTAVMELYGLGLHQVRYCGLLGAMAEQESLQPRVQPSAIGYTSAVGLRRAAEPLSKT